MRRVIVESPFAGQNTLRGFALEMQGQLRRKLEETANILYARAAVRDSVLRGEAPIASHLLLTQPGILDDDVPEERRLGIEAGLAWRDVADASVVYIDRGVSGGMRYGMQLAAETGLPCEQRSLPGDWSTAALAPWTEVLRLAHAVAVQHHGPDLDHERARDDLESALLQAKGWEFFQTGPDEAAWLKYDDTATGPAAHVGSAQWRRDYDEVRQAADRLARHDAFVA